MHGNLKPKQSKVEQARRWLWDQGSNYYSMDGWEHEHIARQVITAALELPGEEIFFAYERTLLGDRAPGRKLIGRYWGDSFPRDAKKSEQLWHSSEGAEGWTSEKRAIGLIAALHGQGYFVLIGNPKRGFTRPTLKPAHSGLKDDGSPDPYHKEHIKPFLKWQAAEHGPPKYQRADLTLWPQTKFDLADFLSPDKNVLLETTSYIKEASKVEIVDGEEWPEPFPIHEHEGWRFGIKGRDEHGCDVQFFYRLVRVPEKGEDEMGDVVQGQFKSPSKLQPKPQPTSAPDKEFPPEGLLRLYEPRDPHKIPRRQWLHAKHYIRGEVVMTVAPGAGGKTALGICNAIEMITGKGLIGPPPVGGPYRVAYWTGEETDDELDRRIAAVCIYHEIDQEKLRGYLIRGSKLTRGRRLARIGKKGNVVLDSKLLVEIERLIIELKIDCLILDPLVSFNAVPENSHEMEQVISILKVLAERTNIAIELIHHTRKSGAGQFGGDVTADDSRGSGAIINAARSVRLLNRISTADAEKVGIAPEERWQYVRIDRGKPNLTPPGKATWVRLVSVDLMNGEGALRATKCRVWRRGATHKHRR
jgi:hypothetical protein